MSRIIVVINPYTNVRLVCSECGKKKAYEACLCVVSRHTGKVANICPKCKKAHEAFHMLEDLK